MSARRRLLPKPRPCSSAKVPDPLTVGPRLYTIPPTAPFLTTLARALLAGELPLPGGPKPGPLVLPLTTLYLPTRRAARALREAFLAEAGGEAMLLPRIRALGDPDEEASIIFGADDAEGGGLDGAEGAPAIDNAATASGADAADHCLRSSDSLVRTLWTATDHQNDDRASLLSCRRSRPADGLCRKRGGRPCRHRRDRAGRPGRPLAVDRRVSRGS